MNLKNTQTNLLLGYIFNKKPRYDKYFDFLKETYDLRFYHYGNHFKYHFENSLPFKGQIKNTFRRAVVNLLVLLLQNFKSKKRTSILSTIYFNADLFYKKNYDINVSRPPWDYNRYSHNIFDWSLHRKSQYLKKQFRKGNFAKLTSDEFLEEIGDYYEALKAYISKNNISALFVAHDIGFFEKAAISAFRELEKPTFVFVHGLQFWLNEFDLNRTDYLVVWGDLSKKDFVDHGFNANKIIVSGHPLYRVNNTATLRFGLDRILVLGNSLNGITPSEEYLLTDRSNCIYYLKLIQDCLERLGVKKVYLRPHPSENPNWYLKNIDRDFFEIDSEPLDISLAKSSLVIGPTSTVFLEAIQKGVNYTVFNPDNQYGKGLNGLHIPPIFNGEYKKVPVAKNLEQLEIIIRSKKTVDISILNELISREFSLDQVHQIINNQILYKEANIRKAISQEAY